MRTRYDDFEKAGAEILEVSVNAAPVQKAWAAALGGVPFPILADFHPKGAVAGLYGVYNEEQGRAKRATFVIDRKGVIRNAQEYAPGTIPDPEELLAAVSGLS